VRFAIASLALAGYVAFTRPSLPKLADFPRIMLAGACGIAAYNLLLNSGEQVVDAGTASFLINTAPIFAALLGAAFLEERLRFAGWVGSAISFIGVAFIATGGGMPGFGKGAMLVLAAAMCQALQFLLQKPLLRTYGALPVTAYFIWCGTLLLLPFLPAAIGSLPSANNAAIASVVYLALGPAAISYVAWSYVLSRLPVSRAASYLYLVPLVASLIAWLWLDEMPALSTVIGGTAALFGVILVNTLGRVIPKQASDQAVV
jgi:drug/metabolite transporter (DMT)-like permease